MADLDADYRKQLLEAYETKKKANPRYSRNAFSKTLGIDSTYLSKVMTGKIIPSLEIAEKIARRLELSAPARKHFLLSVAEEQRCHALYQIDPTLTECDPEDKESNALPKSRTKKESKE